MPVIARPEAPTHDLGDVRFTALATPSRGSSETAVWQVEIGVGAPAAPHSLTREEVFVVLAGRAGMSIGGVEATAEEGDAIVVPPDTDFALSNSGDVPLRLLCCLPVGGQARLDGQTFTPPWAE